MTAATPSSTVQMADEAFNRGDIDGMVAFYEDGAKFLFRPGELLSGKAEIHKALTQLLPMKPVARHEKTHLIEAGDIALWMSKWSVSGVAQDGSRMCRDGIGTVVLRKGVDGGWRVASENPWGGAVLDSAETISR